MTLILYQCTRGALQNKGILTKPITHTFSHVFKYIDFNFLRRLAFYQQLV